MLCSQRCRGRALTEVSPPRTCTEPKPPWKQPPPLSYAWGPHVVFGPLVVVTEPGLCSSKAQERQCSARGRN